MDPAPLLLREVRAGTRSPPWEGEEPTREESGSRTPLDGDGDIDPGPFCDLEPSPRVWVAVSPARDGDASAVCVSPVVGERTEVAQAYLLREYEDAVSSFPRMARESAQDVPEYLGPG